MSDYKINIIGDHIDIEIPKGKSTEEMKVIAEKIKEEMRSMGITGYKKLTEEDRDNIRQIAKAKGQKVIEEKRPGLN